LCQPPVVRATGLLAWRWQLEGQRLEGILLQHMLLGIVSGVLIWLTWSFHFRVHRNPAGRLPLNRLPSELAVAAVVA